MLRACAIPTEVRILASLFIPGSRLQLLRTGSFGFCIDHHKNGCPTFAIFEMWYDLKPATESVPVGLPGKARLAYAFTEHGAIMAATVLNSERAIEMSVFVVLAFVRMRRAIAGNRNILTKLAELEHRLKSHDSDIQDLMGAIRELMRPEDPTVAASGFEAPSEAGGKALKGRAMQLRKNR